MTNRTPNQNSGPITYFIRTFGCQMNVADSLMYSNVLENLGCLRSESEELSDILVINTCSVRAKAEEKAISYLGAVMRKRAEFRERAGISSGSGIAFVGCMATVRGDEIKRRFPQVRLVLPARELNTFEDRILASWPELARSVSLDKTVPLPRPEERFERFVPIVRGCANRCTYCIVPAARGDTIRSKSPDEIFREIESLTLSGIRSITFLGQNVCAYGRDIESKPDDIPMEWSDISPGYGFFKLLADVRDRFGGRGIWFKFLTSHPRDVTNELIDVVASHPSFSRGFHFPLQAGDDEVLRRMARGYTSTQYRDLISRVREKIPDMRLTTDLIVGFPGEDEAAFERTLEMVRDIGFDAAFTFLYSSRAGTPAEKWADPVPREEKKRRLQMLIDLQNNITLERARAHVGQERVVLIEGPATGRSAKGSNFISGRTREGEVVLLPGDPDDCGRMVKVRLTRANLRSFTAERLNERSRSEH